MAIENSLSDAKQEAIERANEDNAHVKTLPAINSKGVRKLLEDAEFVLGSFSTENGSGYQLTIGLRIPLYAGTGKKREKVSERTEWHNITFGDIPPELPDVHLHASYSDLDAIRILYLHELAYAQKNRRTPRFEVKLARWGSGNRTGTWNVPAGENPEERTFGGLLYHFYIGHAGLTVAARPFESKDTFISRKLSWNTERDRVDSDGRGASFHYRYDREET